MGRVAWLALLLAAGGGDEEPVPFAPPWDDASPGPTSLAATLHRPAGGRGPVRAKDGRLWAGDERLRLFGANFTAGACFPDRPTAEKVAARMAKFGLNAARLHFLDATWGSPRLVRYESGDWTRWDAEALDRLDYFVAKLREQGIYVNLNLLVGRRFGAGDGVDPAIARMDWKGAHAVGFFHGPHLAAQKEYARRLLRRRNPHTGLTYAEDPAVAIVEINNENGLLHAWMDGAFETLPEPFAGDLAGQWNRWLAARHADTAALSRAWGARAEPPGGELLANAAFAEGLQAWAVEQHQGAKASARAEAGAVALRIDSAGPAGWHVQLNQSRLALAKGALYTATVRASADRPRKVSLQVMQAHEPWGSLGLRETLALDREPRTFAFTFVAPESDDRARYGLSDLSQAGAEFRFSELSLRPGGRLGLSEGESLERRSVAVPGPAFLRRQPDGARSDWIRFLWETERAHWREMRRFLREDAGVRGLLTGTIVATSTPNLMADLDVVDTHAYWEHPRFPGTPWDRNHWFVRNVSMVDRPEEATVTRLALQRVEGKPHMVSEYNHPAPNLHAGEGPLFLAALAGLQDWDALFLYTYSHDDAKTKAGRIPDFFDVGQHPTIMANAVASSLLFRRGDVPPAGRLLRIPFGPEREIDLVARHGAAWNVAPVARAGVDPKVSLRARTALDLAAAPGAALPAEEPPGAPEAVAWRAGLFEVRAPRAKALIGRVDGRVVDLGHGVRVTVGKTRTGWCTVALVALEGDSLERGPGRALLVATGTAENTEMGWKNPEKSTVGKDWGKAPSLVEVVPAAVRFSRPAAPAAWALDDRGQRAKAAEVAAAGEGAWELRIGPPHRTLWYEIELR